jgi:hypothetical protein
MSNIFYIDYHITDRKDRKLCFLSKKLKHFKYFKNIYNKWIHVDLRDYKYNLLNSLCILVENFFNTTNIDTNKIVYIVTTDPTIVLPKTTHKNYTYISLFFKYLFKKFVFSLDTHLFIQNKFKLKNSSVFLVDQLYGASCLAIGLASSLLTHKGDYIIILSRNAVDHHSSNELYPKFKFTSLPSASIMIISKESFGLEIIDYFSITDRYNRFSNDNKSKKINHIIEELHLKGSQYIKKFILKNRMDSDKIYSVISESSIPSTCIDFYANALNISKNKFSPSDYLDNKNYYGNINLARNIKNFIQNYPLPDKSYILLYCFGLYFTKDMSYNMTLLRYNC